jgi:hypothetical protein
MSADHDFSNLSNRRIEFGMVDGCGAMKRDSPVCAPSFNPSQTAIPDRTGRGNMYVHGVLSDKNMDVNVEYASRTHWSRAVLMLGTGFRYR